MYRTTIFDKALQSERRTDLLFDADWKFLRGNANNAELSDFDDSSWRLLDLQFGGIYMNADIWLNGKSLGNHPYGYTGFRYDITSFLNPGKENILAVKVRNEGHNSRWYIGSGIYRHVSISIMNSVHLDPWWVFVTTPVADKIHANINISSTVFNESTEPSDLILVTHIVDRSGAEVADKESKQQVSGNGKYEFVQELQNSHIIVMFSGKKVIRCQYL